MPPPETRLTVPPHIQVRQGYPRGDIHINEDLDVFDVSPRGVARRKRLVPDLTWGPWVAENNWHTAVTTQQQQGGAPISPAAAGDEAVASSSIRGVRAAKLFKAAVRN